MMEFVAYSLLTVWFIRGWVIPKKILIICLLGGFIFINAIGLYRVAIKKNEGLNLFERIRIASEQDYLSVNIKTLKNSGPEFENYLFGMYAMQKTWSFDFGVGHWNMIVFSYVPAQLVGRSFKTACS